MNTIAIILVLYIIYKEFFKRRFYMSQPVPVIYSSGPYRPMAPMYRPMYGYNYNGYKRRHHRTHRM